jgi:diadenosine tetraphosphate (Ap4A) HIT family hydrolase
MMLVGSKIAKQQKMDKKGYRMVVNEGKHGCQTV